MRAAGRVVSRDSLIEQVWGDREVTANNLEVFVRFLRAKVDRDDDEAGIAPDDQPHNFERFWRADKVRAREDGGAGLGLPIARQIAEQHGAGLSVESEAGGGSVFALRLPAG